MFEEPPYRVYPLTVTTLKKSTCVKHKQGYPTSLKTFRVIDSLFTFKQPKDSLKRAALLLPLPSGATVEKKPSICKRRMIDTDGEEETE